VSIHILVVEDEPDVLDAIVADLAAFEDRFRIETAASAEAARRITRRLAEAGDAVGLVLCDHLLPGQDGVDLLVELQGRDETRHSRKVLITGHAGLDETVKAVNEADLNHYIAKPWRQEVLERIVRDELTEYVLAREGDVLPYMDVLDAARLADRLHRGGSLSDA